MDYKWAILAASLGVLASLAPASAYTLDFANVGADDTVLGTGTVYVNAPGGERIGFSAADSQFVLLTQGPSLYGTQFADGTRVLSPGLTSSPVTLSFSRPLESLSLSASSLRFGAFTATVSLFDGKTLIASQPISSDVEGPGANGPLPMFAFSGFGVSRERITSATINIDQPSNIFGGSVLLGPVSYSLSTVPLPASAPMFGAALLALGAIGYGLKRKAAAA